jgi:tRNA dimethylallyltransferase
MLCCVTWKKHRTVDNAIMGDPRGCNSLCKIWIVYFCEGGKVIMQPPLILCLMGPTASGKTALAVELVQRFPFEIISVDSAMVYRGLDIGTAKPTPDILERAPHRLLDIREPEEVYSAGDFQIDALREIKDILQKGKVPLLVGGTMLYFHVLQQGLDDLPEQDPQIRAQIQEEAEQEGWTALHQKLGAVDPRAAARIHPHDGQRIQRALEVYALTGKPLTDQQLQGQTTASLPYPLHHLILCPEDRSPLHKRIEKRFSVMIEQGFLDEVKNLHQRPELSLEKPAMRSVGYRQAWEYLEGKLSFDEMKEKTVIATRQLAKRQITWLRRWKDAAWFDSESEKTSEKLTHFIRQLIESGH